MKNVILLSLILVLVSGCLIQPNFTIKEISSENDMAVIQLHSNKPTTVSFQVLNEDGIELCSADAGVNSGNNEINFPCVLSDSKVTVVVVSEGVTFSKELTVQFGSGSVNDRVIALAKTTLEGEVSEMLSLNLKKSSQCNAEKFVEKMQELMDYSQQNYPDSYSDSFDLDLTPEEMETLQEKIDETNKCNLRLEKKITNISGQTYLVSYSLLTSGECSSMGPAQDDVIVIEVDLQTNSTNVTKGKISSSASNQQMIKSYEIFGECTKAILMGVSSALINAGTFTEQPHSAEKYSCDGGQNFKITGFSIEPDYSVLHIENNSGKEIEITGFSGVPIELSCKVCPKFLNVSGLTIYNLNGNFIEKGLGTEIEERITVSYLIDDMAHTELFNCIGIVENSWGKIEVNTDTNSSLNDENHTIHIDLNTTG